MLPREDTQCSSGAGGALTAEPPRVSVPPPQHLPGCLLVPALHWVVIFFPKGNPGTARQTDLFPATGEHRVTVRSQPGKCPFSPLVFLVIQGQRRGALVPQLGEPRHLTSSLDYSLAHFPKAPRTLSLPSGTPCSYQSICWFTQ